MKIFNKNSWLNFMMTLFGFTFFYSLSSSVIDRFYTQGLTEAMTLNLSCLWIVNGTIAFILSLGLVIFFCKPRAPFYIAIATLLSGCVSLRPMLAATIIHLDDNLRHHGLVALYTLLPHLFLVCLAVIAFYVAWLSNRSAKKC